VGLGAGFAFGLATALTTGFAFGLATDFGVGLAAFFKMGADFDGDCFATGLAAADFFADALGLGGMTGFFAFWGFAGDLGAAFLGAGWACLEAGLTCFLAGAADFFAGLGGTTGLEDRDVAGGAFFTDFLEVEIALPGLEVVFFVAMGASLSVRMDIAIV
jgi:hypothetical protein